MATWTILNRTNVVWTAVAGTVITWSNAYRDIMSLYAMFCQDTTSYYSDIVDSY